MHNTHTHTHTTTHTHKDTLKSKVWRELSGALCANQLFASYISQQIWKNNSDWFLQMSFWWKKMTSRLFFLYVCVLFFLPSGFHPRRPGIILRESHFLFPPLWLMFFIDISVGSTTRHSQHTTTRDPEKKRDFTTIVASNKEKPQKRKAKETRMEFICCL